MKKWIFTLILFLSGWTLNGQQVNDNSISQDSIKEKKEFRMSGKPIVAIFTNFQYGFAGLNGTAGFNLDRSYLGYQFHFAKDWSTKVVFDVGTPNLTGSDLERIAYIKNALLSWTPGNLTLNAGLIGLEQFALQESFFGYRYIAKSFQDEYKFGYSADLGIAVKYKFARWISADMMFVNGEGYKKLQSDNKFRYGAGITFNPLETFFIRAYYDRSDHPEADTLGKAQENLAFFLGYKDTHFSVGAEWNNVFNFKHIDAKHQYGASVYFSVFLPKRFEIFGRWDYLTSNNSWNSNNDKQVAMLGFQYSPIKYIRISPNCRVNIPVNGKIGILVRVNLLITM